MLRLVERHGEIRSRLLDGPRGNDGALLTIDHRYVARRGYVDKNTRSGFLELERFRVALERDFAQALARRRVHLDQRSAAVADPDAFRGRVEAHVVGVVPDADDVDELQRGAVIDAALAIAAISHEHAVQIGGIGDALGLVQAFGAGNTLARRQVEHLHRIVAERGYEEPLALDVRGEVVDASFHVGHGDGLDEAQWR